MAGKFNYSPLSLEEKKDLGSPSDSESHIGSDCDVQESRGGSLRRALPWVLHAMCIMICLALLGYTKYSASNGAQACLPKHNVRTPVLDILEDQTIERRMNGSLKASSPYRGHPDTPSVRESWEELIKYGGFRATKQDMMKAGASLDSSQFSPQEGGGYVVISEGTHLFHCLNVVWKDHYIDSMETLQVQKQRDPQKYETHFEHCVELLRQKLECNFDAGMIPFNWVKGLSYGVPNYSTLHKCVDYNKIHQWLKDNQNPDSPWIIPDDAVFLDEEP